MAGKGAGSTVGQLGGAAIGAYTGVPGGAEMGATAGSALGGALDPTSQDPRQTKQKLGSYDPYASFPAIGQIENAVLANMGRGGGGGGNPYVGPRPEQERMLAALEGYQGQASPLFGESVQQQRDVVGGKYLDPMNSPAFQRMADARQSLARQMFGDARTGVNATSRAFNSSARQAQLNREAGRVSTQAAQDIAQAGWGQYGAERGYQEQASRGGTALAPGLAASVFEGGEKLRSAEQAGNTEAIESALRARGYDDASIRTALQYMSLRGTKPVSPIVGQSPNEAMQGYIKQAAPIVQGLGNTLADWWKRPDSQPPAGLGDQVAAMK
jgi:hypothetical protein